MLPDNLSPAAPSTTSKRKRRPTGTPDPDAEVVALSPKTLLESDRYVCEICNQGFQRDQNLQMHRRRHKVPWKLLKRESPEVPKRVYVCPELACLHHDPAHALGDLVGIKKHYRRKHSDQRQWVCARCSKAYAVHSDYKAHLKTCGTRGHSCDCGRVFSRVESFIEHQDICNRSQKPADLPISVSSAPWLRHTVIPSTLTRHSHSSIIQLHHHHQTPPQALELLLLPASGDTANTQLHLSIGSGDVTDPPDDARTAADEKAAADEARRLAKRQVEVAEEEFNKARRIRQEAHDELIRALVFRDCARNQFDSTLQQITCSSCRQRFRSSITGYVSAVFDGDHYGEQRKGSDSK